MTRDQPKVAFLHIPKTAGTSIAAAINEFAIPWVHIVSQPAIHAGLNFHSAREHLQSVRENALSGAYSLMFGHMTLRDFSAAIGQSDFVFGTMLRHPEDRLISEYNYITSPKQPGGERFLNRFPTIECYIEECGDTNVLSHYLERFRGEPAVDIASRMVEQFCFIGFMESYATDIDVFASIFGRRTVSQRHLNSGGYTRQRLPRALRRLTERRNARDFEIYHLCADARRRP